MITSRRGESKKVLLSSNLTQLLDSLNCARMWLVNVTLKKKKKEFQELLGIRVRARQGCTLKLSCERKGSFKYFQPCNRWPGCVETLCSRLSALEPLQWWGTDAGVTFQKPVTWLLSLQDSFGMSHLLKNLILNILVNHKVEGAAEVPSEWV